MLLAVLKGQCSADDATDILVAGQAVAVSYDVVPYGKATPKASASDDLIRESVAARLDEVLEGAVWTSRCIIWCWCCDLPPTPFQLRPEVVLLYPTIRQPFMRLKKCGAFSPLIGWGIRAEMPLEYRVWRSKILRWSHTVIGWIRGPGAVGYQVLKVLPNECAEEGLCNWPWRKLVPPGRLQVRRQLARKMSVRLSHFMRELIDQVLVD